MSLLVHFMLLCALSNKVGAKTEILKNSLPVLETNDFHLEIVEKIKREYSTVVIFNTDPSSACGSIIEQLHPCPVILTNGGYLKINPHIAKRPNYIIIFVDSVEELKLERFKQNSLWNVRAYFHFITSKPIKEYARLKTTLQRIWKNDILHFVVIYNHNQAITYNPFFDRIINISDSKKIYENKLNNINGFPLRVCFFADPPRIVEKNNVYYGVDAMVMMGFARKMKGTVEIVGTGYPKTVDEKFFKHFLQVRGRKCDFGLVSCFTIELEQLQVISSYPRRMDGIVVLIPHTSTIPQFYYLFMVFSGMVWVFILVSFLAVAFCKLLHLKCLKAHADISKLFLETWGASFGVFVTVSQKYAAIRLLSLLWFFSTSIFNTHFQSLLTSNLVTPKFLRNPDTLHELKRNKSTIFINRSNFRAIAEQYPSSLVHADSEHRIMGLITKGDTSAAYAIQSSVAELISLKKSEDGQPVYHIIKELLVPGYTSYLFPTDSPYLDEANKYILLDQQFGLSRLSYVNYASVNSKQKRQTKSVRVINLRHLQGAFCLFAIGIASSLICFVFELIIFRITTLKRFSALSDFVN